MICPRCQAPNENGAAFCMQCGMRLTPPAPSPVKKGLLAFARAMCYYFLFIGVQVAAVFLYEFALAFSIAFTGAAGMILSGGELDYDKIFSAVYDQIAENIHIVLILSALVTILIVFLSFRLRHKNPLAETHIRPISPIAVVPSLLLGAALQVFTVFSIAMIPIPAETIDSFNQNSELLMGGPLGLEILSVVVVTPIIEELIFRGLVFTRLSRGMKTWLAVLLSAVIFGWAHGHIISFVYAGVFGVCLALLLKRQNGSILAPILCHAGFNGTSYLIGLLGEEIPDMLFLALYFVSIAVSILCLYILLRKPAEASIQENTSRKDSDNEAV